MILSDVDIQRELGYDCSCVNDDTNKTDSNTSCCCKGGIEIERPEGDLSIQPASVDLHLGSGFVRETDLTTVKVDKKWTYPNHKTVEADSFTLEPYEFALAHTQEYVTMDDAHLGKLDGRSSVGRLGQFVENAGLVDPGFDKAQLTLELFNASQNPIELKQGMRIVQMTIQQLKTPSNVDYGETGKYNGQTGATPSRLYDDFSSETKSDRTQKSSQKTSEYEDFTKE